MRNINLFGGFLNYNFLFLKKHYICADYKRNNYMKTLINYSFVNQAIMLSSVSKPLTYNMLHERITAVKNRKNKKTEIFMKKSLLIGLMLLSGVIPHLAQV